MGFIGKAVGGAVKGIFGGGKGSKGYSSPFTGQYEQGAREIAYNMAGAQKTLNPNYKPGSGKPGEQQYNYDFSKAGQPYVGQGGVRRANEGYDYSGLNKAMKGFSKGPQKLTQEYSSGYKPTAYTPGQAYTPSNAYTPGQYTASNAYKPTAYTPTNFDFKTLPDEYFNQAYASGSKNIRREGQGQLSQLQQALGTRNAGRLFKAGQQATRDTGEQLAGLGTQLGLQRMQQGVDLGVEQQKAQEAARQYAAGLGEQQAQYKGSQAEQQAQYAADLAERQGQYKGTQAEQQAQYAADLAEKKAQFGANFGEQQAQFGAGEGYKGYQSRAENERANAQLIKEYLQGLASVGQSKVSDQMAATSNAQQDQLNRMNYLMNLYQQSMGGNQQAAGLQSQNRGTTLGFLGGLAKAAF